MCQEIQQSYQRAAETPDFIRNLRPCPTAFCKESTSLTVLRFQIHKFSSLENEFGKKQNSSNSNRMKVVTKDNAEEWQRCRSRTCNFAALDPCIGSTNII